MVGSIKIFILDASFAMAFLLPDEKTEEVVKIFAEYTKGTIKLISCPLLPHEVANSLLSAVRQKRISKQTAKKLLEEFKGFDIELALPDLEEAFDLAITRKISIYDAEYVSLALSQNLELLTLDRALSKLLK